LNSNFSLYNKDIESIFDDSYFFKPIDQITDKEISFSNSSIILETLLDNIEKFRNNENFNLDADELALTNKFAELVKYKKADFSTLQSLYHNRVELINRSNEILAKKNASLSLKSREKESSNHRLASLKSNVMSLFNILNRLQKHSEIIESYQYNFEKSIKISSEVDVVLELENFENVKDKILEGFVLTEKHSLYQTLILLASNKIKIKNLPDNSADNLKKKLSTQLKPIVEYFDKPIEYLKYAEENTSKNNSPGYNSEKYLETILKNGNAKIIFIDQPEDNLGNRFITDNLIDIIRDLKFQKQIFLVTHNPSIVVYGDAENIIMCTNIAKKITYEQFVLEDRVHQKEICDVLDGGHYIFDQRSRKYNIKKLLQS